MLRALLCILAVAGVAAGSTVKVVPVKDGSYTVLVDSEVWFASGPTYFTKGGSVLSTKDGSLKLANFSSTSGADALGSFTATTWEWAGGDFVTTVRQYRDALVFEQVFPNGVAGTTTAPDDPMSVRDHTSSAFPALVPAKELGFLAFASDMMGSGYKYGTVATHGSVGKCRLVQNTSALAPSEGGYSAWTRSGGVFTEHSGDYCDCSGHHNCNLPHTTASFEQCKAACTAAGCLCFDWEQDGTGGSGLPTGVKGFGPTCLFTEDLNASLVISSFSQFMVASAQAAGDGVAYGLQASVTAVPPGYALSYIIALSPEGGVNAAFEAWGDKVLGVYGKEREGAWRDYAMRYLGYSTDNGAFYYYQTEGHTPGKRGPPYVPGKTYEETLIDVKAYADSEGIPYKYILLDSWWYYQGVGSGVTNWIGRPDVFPHGNDYLRNKTGWPIMGHNRYWAIDNVYCTENGGAYEFVVEKKDENPHFHNFAWPKEQRFWDDLLYNSSQWGLFMYEQDWLDTEYDNVVHLNTDADAARTWLLQMGNAARRNDLTIQYCMSHCRHIMQSVEIPAVTNARASGDYHPGKDQWKPLGTTGIFGWAIGVAPTKDNFWSTDVQAGSSYSDYKTIKEPYNRLQSAVSTLSKGPVAPSDKIGRSDAALILKSCAQDGLLLQGDTPAMTLDRLHHARAFNGSRDDEVWATRTVLGEATFAVVLGATLSSDQTVSLAVDVRLPAGSYVMFEANHTDVVVQGDSIALKKCEKWDFQVWAVAPRLANGWALLGEPSKWVPVSGARFSRLSFSGTGASAVASVVITGSAGEKVDVMWLAPAATKPSVVSCTIPQGAMVEVRVGAASSSCVDV